MRLNMSDRIAARDWARALQSFTNRNAGRITVLEETDEQRQTRDEERGYALRGVDYDPKAKRVDIMLGDLAGTRHHLTRGITQVHHIELLAAVSGRDLLLRIRRKDGETVLRFSDNYL